jgi:hypothetical protein
MRLSPEATIGLLNEVERRFAVADWTMGSIRVWPIVRAAVWWTVNANFAQQRVRLQSENRLLRRARQATQLPQDWARAGIARFAQADRHADIRRPADVVILGDNVSRIPLEGFWYDRLCQPFVEELDSLGVTTLHLEPNHLYRGPRANASVRIQPRLDALWIRSRVRVQTPAESLPGYDEFLRELRDRTSASAGMELDELCRQVAYLLLTARWFERVLATVRPRLVMNVDLGIVQMALHLACRRAGITSVEIQHGAVRENHAFFSAWADLPPQGFELLPAVYWVWGEQEAGMIRQWSAATTPRHRPIIGGNLWLQRWVHGGNELVDRFDARVRSLRAPGPDGVNVLVALSTGVTSERDLRAVRDGIVHSPEGWRWWIRRHPTMAANELRQVEGLLGESERVIFDAPSTLPLYALLRGADVHVTQRSSVVEEAAAFGVPTVITEAAAAASTFKPEIESGWAVIAEDGPALLAGITTQLGRRPELPPVTTGGPRSPRDLLGDLLAGS